jgi:NAD(P)-dependent dehydrogenase (short-subunit alcohol dehydrogenase family)
MSKRLQDKVALVTGGSSGIGEATARLFIKEGAKVGVVARTVDELQDAVDRMTENGGEAVALPADISKPNEMQMTIEKLVAKWNRLDIVFANAGINGVWAPIDKLSPEEWRRTIDINLNGTFYTLKYAIPPLKKQGGSIIVTSSVNGTRKFSNTGATAYAASKAGQVALAKMLALELAEYDIRVNVICPGAIETDIDERTERQDLEDAGWPVNYPEGHIPLRDGKPGTPEQVANLVLFLASEASDHITGTPIWIDGAETLLQG